MKHTLIGLTTALKMGKYNFLSLAQTLLWPWRWINTSTSTKVITPQFQRPYTVFKYKQHPRKCQQYDYWYGRKCISCISYPPFNMSLNYLNHFVHNQVHKCTVCQGLAMENLQSVKLSGAYCTNFERSQQKSERKREKIMKTTLATKKTHHHHHLSFCWTHKRELTL